MRPTGWTGTSHPCTRCGEITAGIAVGELCAKCTRDVDRKASRIGRLAAVVTTLLVAVYVLVRLRSVPPAWQGRVRTVAGIAVVSWYLLTYRIAKRIALEWLK